MNLWLVVSLFAAIAMFTDVIVAAWAPGLILFTAFVAVVVWVPTVWLYLTAALLVHALLGAVLRRRRPPRILLPVLASTIAVGLGILVPVLANREMARLMLAGAGDFGERPMLAPVATAAYLEQPLRVEPEERCWEECQRLLFSGWARSYFRGSAELLRHPGRRSEPLIRHEIVPMTSGCDNSRLSAVPARAEKAGDSRPHAFLWDKLADLRRQGRCFRSIASRDAIADVYFVRIRGRSAYGVDRRNFDFRLLPIDLVDRGTILRRQDGRLVPLMQRTRLAYRRLAVPLRITPPFIFDVHRPGHWSYARVETVGHGPAPFVHEWLANDLTISGLDR